MTLNQINEIKRIAKVRRKEFPNWRKGQAIFNTAFELHPYWTNLLRGSIHDCFYQDSLIDEFLNQLGK